MANRASPRRLDLRGAICPGPTVDTRLMLKEMAIGERLEVTTDYIPIHRPRRRCGESVALPSAMNHGN